MHGTAVAHPPSAEERQPFTVGLAAATSIGLSPRWVQYSGVSAPACKVAEALVDLVTMNTRGDQHPTLDREFLAYAANYGRADRLAAPLRELQDIGFLRIFDGGGTHAKTGRRRQRRNQDGRPLPDHFEISLEPPAGYVGPRNLTELHAQFILDRDAVYRAAEKAGKPVRVGRHAITRTEIGRLDPAQVEAVTGIRGQDGVAVTGMRGQAEFPQVEAVTGIRGPLQIDQRSSISEREIEEIEPVPGGAAEPPATGRDERQGAAVRELVRRLPWAQWAQRYSSDFRLTPADADEVQTAICDAIATAGITLEQARKIGQAALGEARKTPVTYVTDAFRKHLPRRLRALAVEPLSDDPLPLPGKPEQPGKASPGLRKQSEKSAGEGPAESAERGFPEKCPTCGCVETDVIGDRLVPGPDGRNTWCPDCVTNAS